MWKATARTYVLSLSVAKFVLALALAVRLSTRSRVSTWSAITFAVAFIAAVVAAVLLIQDEVQVGWAAIEALGRVGA